MDTRRKLWLVLIGTVLAMTVIACLSTPTPAAPPSPTVPPSPTAPPLPTAPPSPTVPPSPTAQPPSMAGRWNDPDTPGTVTTIEERNGEYVVVSVINPDRGVNELTWTTYENGVLSWEYCPADMHCITSETVSVTSDTLTATWTWTDGGNGGTTYFERLP
jgi:hypothetical protein